MANGAVPVREEQIALFVTCLVDLMRPQVGHAVLRILQTLGIAAVTPPQVCCGQPNYNSGDRRGARAIARATIDTFEPYSKVLVPSGSCAGMLIRHYPQLFEASDRDHDRARDLADRTEELLSFLARQDDLPFDPSAPPLKLAYHDGCSGLRELGVQAAPRRLLARAGVEICELAHPEVCCGFGGAFAVKHGEISARLVDDKAIGIIATGAQAVAAGDVGCLLNIEGRLARRGAAIPARHLAEVLAERLGQERRP